MLLNSLGSEKNMRQMQFYMEIDAAEAVVTQPETGVL